MVRNSILNPPMTWDFNRVENSNTNTTTSDQDYTIALDDFGYLEKVSLTDASGNTQEIKDVYNNSALSKNSVVQRPSAIAVIMSNRGTDVKLRFNSIPDKIYTINLTYQAVAAQFGPFVVNSCGNAAGGNTTYTGIFDPLSFTVGATATIQGFLTAANNGIYIIVSVTSTHLVLFNPNGVAEIAPTLQGSAINSSWFPIPDSYSDIYNNLFLAEAFQAVGEDADAARYRQRGIAAFLAKSEGLDQTQINIFRQQWLQRDTEVQASQLRTAQGNQARGV
jgi:hypothetical protein